LLNPCLEHGLYRLPEVPVSEHDDLIRLSLWSRGRDGEPQAVVSHETALGIFELGVLLPKRVHLTVPPTFRKLPPRGVALHRASITETDVEERAGFRVTSAARTVLDIAVENSVPQEQLEKIVREALDRGLLRRAVLVAKGSVNAMPTRLAEALRRIG
jgi:predicted transcriptional regulator of viral defense system